MRIKAYYLHNMPILFGFKLFISVTNSNVPTMKMVMFCDRYAVKLFTLHILCRLSSSVSINVVSLFKSKVNNRRTQQCFQWLRAISIYRMRLAFLYANRETPGKPYPGCHSQLWNRFGSLFRLTTRGAGWARNLFHSLYKLPAQSQHAWMIREPIDSGEGARFVPCQNDFPHLTSRSRRSMFSQITMNRCYL